MLKIEYQSVAELKAYKGNAKRHPAEQIEQIKRSIQDFGFNDPIALWKNNEIIEGHGRLIAAMELGLETVPVIRLDDLTDEQRRAYALVHNKLTMDTGFDLDILNSELLAIDDFDMSIYDFDILGADGDEEDDGYYGDERERTGNAYNLAAYDEDRTDGFYQIPVLRRSLYVPDGLIGFNYVKSQDAIHAGVHFFIDDYQFERIWNEPAVYIDMLMRKGAPCVLTPDFSLYTNMSRAVQIWNVYRSHLIGQIMADAGLEVIPTLQWAQPESYAFCFDGIEPGGSVAVSTVGVMRDELSKRLWIQGMQEALKRVKPKTILLYGSKIDFDFGDIDVRYYAARGFAE